MSKGTICIVEDEEDISEILSYQLKRDGYHPLCADTGEKGLALIREHEPILVLLDLMLTGLEIGADDYITKPFSPRMVLARIKSVLRRGRRNPVDNPDLLEYGPIFIDHQRHQVRVDDKPVDLTATEFKLLAFLCRRPGWVFTRQQIVDNVRGEDYAVTERSVDVQVVGLRKKLGEHAELIETVRGVGYRSRESV